MSNNISECHGEITKITAAYSPNDVRKLINQLRSDVIGDMRETGFFGDRAETLVAMSFAEFIQKLEMVDGGAPF